MERFSVCLIQPPNYVHSLALLEVAQLLAGSLESLGVERLRGVLQEMSLL